MDLEWLMTGSDWVANHAPTAFSVFLSILHVIGIALAVHAVMTVRTSQGAIAWSLLLLTFPLFGIPAYLVLGRSKFVGYVRAHRTGRLELDHVAKRAFEALAPHAAEIPAADHQRYKVLEKLVRLPFTKGNDARLLIDGQPGFDAMFEAIAAAKRYVLTQFFIIRDDEHGRNFKNLLVSKARDGVEVYLLYDEIGCHALPDRYLYDLIKAGVKVSAFRTAGEPFNRYQLNFRNHRKIVLADGRVAFVGGANMADEYLGRSRRFGPWRDTFVRVEGPAVQCVQLGFLEDWYSSTHETPELEWTPTPAPNGNRNVLILPTGPTEKIETCNLMFLQAIQAARKRLWITSPYFVPDPTIVDALQMAALRGVDIRIMLPQKPDHLLVYLSAFSYFDEMDAVGVKLYRYQPGFMHQKVMLIDDEAAAVGTANLDNRSFRLNFELTAFILDRGFAKEVEQMLEADFAKSRPATLADFEKRPLWFKFAVNFARLWAPVQ